MKSIILLSAMAFGYFHTSEAFYKPVQFKNLTTHVPTTLAELKHFFCETFYQEPKTGAWFCIDTKPARIIVNKTFDFTDYEGSAQDQGCHHLALPAQCLTTGQMQLNVNHQCDGLVATNVTYKVAGLNGLYVGSNKIIQGQNGGGLIGKGIQLINSYNVEIRDLNITEINCRLIWGGDALLLTNVTNILIDGNYFKNIGRQMIVTSSTNKAIQISNNVFDGNTPFSAYCDGTHYWLWLFLGEGETISLKNNLVLNTAGRGPHLVAANNAKTFLYMAQNTFYNVNHMGLIQHKDSISSIFLEGNMFVNVVAIVQTNLGNVFLPLNENDQILCQTYLGRQCLLNKIFRSGYTSSNNSITVLKDYIASGLWENRTDSHTDNHTACANHTSQRIVIDTVVKTVIKLPNSIEKYTKKNHKVIPVKPKKDKKKKWEEEEEEEQDSIMDYKNETDY